MSYLAINNEGLAVSGIWEADSLIEEGLTLVEIVGEAAIGWTYVNGQWVEPPDYGVTYKEERARNYPSLEEQADMQYWDAVNGTTVWVDTIAAVKSRYPKE